MVSKQKQGVGGLCNLGSFKSSRSDRNHRDATAQTATSVLPRFGLSHDVNPADRRRVEYLPTTYRQSGMESVFSDSTHTHYFNAEDDIPLDEELFTCGLTCVHHMFKLITIFFQGSCLLKL